MRQRLVLSAAILLIYGSSLPAAEAQIGRRLGRLRNPPAPQMQPAPGVQPAPPRPPGQLRERVQNLGGKILDSGALDSLTGKASENLPGALPSATPNLATNAQLKATLPAGKQPFTPGWYADHPTAWQYTHPHADAWAVATIGTVAAWLGIPAPLPADAASGENVFTSQSVAPPAEVPEVGDYLPLGVFALGPHGAHDASALVQLAVSKSGDLRGTYYDVVTGQEQPLSGQFDKQTQLATFKLESPDSAEFEISLVSLTRPEGNARLRFTGGQTRDWSLARFEPPAATAK
jgi:hypothetical protein